MSFQLTFGGGETLIVRDKGTSNAVQGFVSSESVVIKNVIALATNFLFQLIEYVQLVIAGAPPAGTIVWLNVSGVWKQTIEWLNVSGTWKTPTTFYNDNGTWK
jgi:hypothetical protein